MDFVSPVQRRSVEVSGPSTVGRSTLKKSKDRARITIVEASQRLEESSSRPDLEPSMSRSSGYSSGDRGGYTSSDGEGLTSQEKSIKRRRFEQRRKQHYNMKEALKRCTLQAEQRREFEILSCDT